MTARDEAIEAAARAIVVQGATEKDTLRVGRGRAAVALDAAIPLLLNDLADRIERDAKWVDDAAKALRAAAEGWGE